MFIPCLVSKRHYYWHHSVFCDMKLENSFIVNCVFIPNCSDDRFGINTQFTIKDIFLLHVTKNTMMPVVMPF